MLHEGRLIPFTSPLPAKLINMVLKSDSQKKSSKILILSHDLKKRFLLLIFVYRWRFIRKWKRHMLQVKIKFRLNFF